MSTKILLTIILARYCSIPHSIAVKVSKKCCYNNQIGSIGNFFIGFH